MNKVENEQVVKSSPEQNTLASANEKRLSIFDQPLPEGWRLVRDAQTVNELGKSN